MMLRAVLLTLLVTTAAHAEPVARPVPGPWKVALIMAAPLMAFEANVLRIAAIGVGLETLGHVPKDWMGWGAIRFGAVQVVGLERLAARRRSETARPASGGR